MEKKFKIFVINPGSTSTRVALYENEKELHGKKLVHPQERIAQFPTINDQFGMRRQVILDYLDETGVKDLDVIVARGGGGRPLRCGGYAITPLMVEECRNAAWPHASNLGVMVAFDLMQRFSIPGYIYDAPSADDFCEYAKLSGSPDFPQLRGAGHPLNEKAAAHRVAKNVLGGAYGDFNFVVAHLGGGITVCAHEKGKIIDCIINAYSPERSGALPMIAFTKACFSGKYTLDEMMKKQMGRGGLMAYLGTSDIQEIERRISAGDAEAEFYFEGMVYQIAKDIGAMAATMNGEVDRVVLTGEIARSRRLTESLTKRVRFIAPVEIVPGTYEMEALTLGVLRIITGQEAARDYDTEQA